MSRLFFSFYSLPEVVQVIHASVALHDAVGVGLEGGALLRHLC